MRKMNDQDMSISKLLGTVKDKIEMDDYAAVSAEIQTLVKEHPDWADDRFLAEVGLIEKQMEYKMQLQDW